MLKKLIASSIVLLAAAGTTGFLVTAQAGATSRFGNTFTVQEHFITSASEGSAPGDTTVGKGTLTQGGNPVGDARFACTNLLDAQVICNGAWTITGHGSLLLEGSQSANTSVFDAVVTGGTGSFAGKDGWVHFDETQPANGSTQTFHLSR